MLKKKEIISNNCAQPDLTFIAYLNLDYLSPIFFYGHYSKKILARLKNKIASFIEMEPIY